MEQNKNAALESSGERKMPEVRGRSAKRKRNRKSIFAASGVAVLSIALAVAGIAVKDGIIRGIEMNDTGNVSYAEEVAKKTEESVESTFPDITVGSHDTGSLTKDETVYVIMDADGTEKERVVNEWLKNPEKLDTIEDMTDLTELKNTNGEETFTQDGKKVIWKADGNDIKYTGKCSADLPVSVEVTYYLDGDEVSPSEIEGRSGDVEIHFDYGVTARDRVVSDGSGYDLTHPYVMASGVVLDNDRFSDVEVSSGRVMNESGSSVCLGIALPGMKENLALTDNKIDIPENVVIKAKTTGFKIDGTYTVALSGLLKDMDTDTSDVTDKLDELESGLGKLKDASSKLVKGSKALSKGADKLSDGTSTLAAGTNKLNKSSKDLADGIGKLTKGSKQLAKGTSDIKDGAKQLEQGSKQISDGLGQLSTNSEALNQGTKQIEDSVFQSATAQLQATLKAGGMPEEQAGKYVLSPSSYSEVLGGLSKALPDYAKAFGQVKGSLDAVETYVASVKTYTDGVDQISQGAEQLTESMGQLKSGAEQVDKGAGQVYGGLSKISEKMPELKKGVSQLNSGAKQLDNGTGQLAAGADTLAGGVAKFDKDGIRKLSGELDVDEITDILGRLDAVSVASGRKHFMGGSPKEIQGESRMIFKTGAIG